tara:strand:+ start:1955 stop:2566 length:612 start_codon:yes stop_codon:yes gene_type:complete
MKFEITDSPNAYLIIYFSKNEKIIIEKESLIYSEGEYKIENKIEAKGYKNLLALLGGKSLSYNIYTAKENLKMTFSTKDTSEIFNLKINNNNSILFNPSNHFARTNDIKIIPSGFDKDLFLKAEGSGELFLKSYGKIIEKKINSDKEIYVNVDSMIAYDENLNVESITEVMKAILTNESELLKVSGRGKIWIQSKDKIEFKKN